MTLPVSATVVPQAQPSGDGEGSHGDVGADAAEPVSSGDAPAAEPESSGDAAAEASGARGPERGVGPAQDQILALEEALGARVVVYWSPAAPMDNRAVLVLGRVLAQLGHQDRLAFIVSSPGGDADSAHRMLSVLREYTDRLDIYVPAYAASAATMLCLGADNLFMGPLSELSPIDPQVPVDARLMLPMSSEAARALDDDSPVFIPAGVIRDFLEFAGVVAGADRASAVDPDRLEHLLKPLNPWIIGWYERATKAARNYARQGLLDHLLGADDADEDASRETREQRAERIVSYLTDHYGSHNASIGRREARQVGIPVQDIPDDVQPLVDDLEAFYDDAFAHQRLSLVIETTAAFQASAATRAVPCSGCPARVELDDDYRFCPECGTALYPTCVCGAPLRAGWSFCGFCGTALPVNNTC